MLKRIQFPECQSDRRPVEETASHLWSAGMAYRAYRADPRGRAV